MSTTALITEYNPFHNGHQYHIEKSKEIYPNNDLLVIMSGNFTQRGNPALINKWARTKQALSCGADLVIELPLIYNIRSAEYFAYYSILSLEKSNIVDSIVFGSESGQLNLLSAIAEVLSEEKTHFQNHLHKYLKKGLNFPSARTKALIESYHNYDELQNFNKNKIKKSLNSPNNILGIEYLKSIFKLNSSIKAQTIKRIGSDYHSQKIVKEFASASLIRKFFEELSPAKALNKTKKLMPTKAWNILKEEIAAGRFINQNSKKLLNSKIIDQLRRLNVKDLKNYKGVNNGIENRLYQKAASSFDNKSFLNSLNAKNLTESRLRRKLLQIYFGLDAQKINIVEKNAPHYLRVLGLRKGKEYLLKDLEENSQLKIIINPAEIINSIELESNTALKLSLSFDLLASDLYALLYSNPKESSSRKDFYQKLIKI